MELLAVAANPLETKNSYSLPIRNSNFLFLFNVFMELFREKWKYLSFNL